MTATSDTKLQNLSWKVGGMDCASCAATIRGAVERLPGVSDVKLSVMSETMTLVLDESQSQREAIEKRVASLGYTTAVVAAKTTAAPTPEQEPRKAQHQPRMSLLKKTSLTPLTVRFCIRICRTPPQAPTSVATVCRWRPAKPKSGLARGMPI